MNEDAQYLLLKNDKVLQLIMLYSFRRCANWDNSSIFWVLAELTTGNHQPKVEPNSLQCSQGWQ